LQEPGTLIQHITLIDYSEAANRHIVGENFLSSHSGKYFAQYVGSHCLAPEGIGYYCVPNGSPSMAAPDWRTALAKKALDDIYTSTEWMWYVDPYKEFRYQPRGYKLAPFNIADTDSPSNYLVNSMVVTLDKSDYYNRLKARIQLNVSGVATNQIITISNDAEIAAMAAREGTSGVYEHWEDITNAGTVEQGIDMGQGMLYKASTLGMTVNYQTLKPGLRAGQVQTIQNAEFGLSGDFLIEQVNIVQTYPVLKYSVTATSWLRYKNSALTNTLVTALNSAKNWIGATATQSTVYLNPLPDDVGIELSLTLEVSGGGESGWDVGLWDSDTWG
jgi:hypothetical protein